jgi:hypothetical protein
MAPVIDSPGVEFLRPTLDSSDAAVGNGMAKPWGWAGSITEFGQLLLDDWLQALQRHTRGLTTEDASTAQITAWRDEWNVLQTAFATPLLRDAAGRWTIVFEFELPFEGGRRPDVVVLAGETVVVLEFKQSPLVTAAHIDQVRAYARDLADYHEASHFRHVEPLLVTTNETTLDLARGPVRVVGRDALAAALARIATPGEIDRWSWLNAPYAPLPALVTAARRIFRHEHLPHVRSALDERIPERLDTIHSIIDRAKEAGQRSLILVTGAPGAGKTLVGLRLVYEHGSERPTATLLSGNGPLVHVLQDALRSSAFVRDLKKFTTSYGTGKRQPSHHVIVFDEAQRAWDESYVFLKKGIAASEPQILVGIADALPGWAVLVGLIGTGQEIYSGEEAGIGQWAEAVRRSGQEWNVVCPPSLAHEFTGLPVTEHVDLALDVPLRARRADLIHDWVRLTLSGLLPEAAAIASRIDQSAFPLYVTRDIEVVRRYIASRYGDDHPDARYGLICSSHARRLHQLPDPDFVTGLDFQSKRFFKIARWFNDGQESDQSGCGLQVVISEFECQGLELDLPVVCWGDDFMWAGAGWTRRPRKRKYPQADPERLLENAYRVLLTRGRDGLIVWVPRELPAMDATYDALRRAGMRELDATNVELT